MKKKHSKKRKYTKHKRRHSKADKKSRKRRRNRYKTKSQKRAGDTEGRIVFEKKTRRWY